MKKLYEIQYSTAYTVGCEKRVYNINTTVYSYQEKYFHRLESDSIIYQFLTKNYISF